jgi:hypothetical protein
MGLFRNKTAPAIGSAQVPVRAAAAGATQFGALYNYSVGAGVERATTVPTLSRAVNLLISIIGGLDFKTYTYTWNPVEAEYDEIEVQGESWMTRPDPRNTRQFIIGSTVSDLFWNGRAFWHVTSRYSNGFPASFQWLPFANVGMLDEAGPYWFGQSQQMTFAGTPLITEDIVQFISPTPGVLFSGSRAIDIALSLDQSARRFARNDGVATGYLQQTGGEPMTGDELGELAAAWVANRADTNSVGALNEFVKYVPLDSDPSKLQITEGREYSALDLSRVANIPAYLLGISTGGMTYQNAEQSVRDLYLFGARPIMHTIEETLSLDMVIARGRHVRFDTDDMFEQERLLEMPDRPEMEDTPQ